MDALMTVLIPPCTTPLKKTEGRAIQVAGSVYVREAQDARARRGEGRPSKPLTRWGISPRPAAQRREDRDQMDEERRTSVNLKEFIRAAKHRVCFINTGFLDRDRRRDPIPPWKRGQLVPKGEMKSAAWIAATRTATSDIGLACGLRGPARRFSARACGPFCPDRMQAMLEAKIGHSAGGRRPAPGLPSPTAATLHATHYHKVSVAEVQAQIAAGRGLGAAYEDLLDHPAGHGDATFSDEEIAREVGSTPSRPSGILGYVVALDRPRGSAVRKVPDNQSDIGPQSGPRDLPDLQPRAFWRTGCITARSRVSE